MAALVLVLIFAAIKTSGKGKNRLGKMIGFASSLSLLLPAGINILVNLGLFPAVNTFLPFLSKGNSYLLVSYVLLGLILSVYRYKDILSEKACQRQENHTCKEKVKSQRYIRKGIGIPYRK